MRDKPYPVWLNVLSKGMFVGPEPCGAINGYLTLGRVGESFPLSTAHIFTEVLLMVILSLDLSCHLLDFFFTVLRLYYGFLVDSSMCEPRDPSVR